MPRLAHKKSRKGCRRCRERKVKCDERHPVCGACAKHKVSCHFDDRFVFAAPPTRSTAVPPARDGPDSKAPPARPSSRPNVGGMSSSADAYRATDDIFPELPAADEPERDRLLELRLMHHYVVNAYHDLFFADLMDIVQHYIPELCFEYPFMLDTTLAFSALHLHRTQREGPGDFYQRVHQSYFSRAVRGHKAAVESAHGTVNTDPHFLAMSLIGYQTFLLLHEEEGPYQLPMMWLQFLCGVRSIAAQLSPFAHRQNRMQPFFDQIREGYLEDFKFEPYAQVMLELDPIWGTCDRDDEAEGVEAYNTFRRCLGAVHVSLRNRRDPKMVCRQLFMTPTVVGHGLPALLAAGKQRAVAMFGHFFRLFELVEGAYPWFEGIAARQVEGIEQMLEPEWREAMNRIPAY